MNQQSDMNRSDIRRSFDRSAAHYDEAAVLQRHVADGLMDRLGDLDITPGAILELGCGTGYMTELLVQQFPDADIVACDLSPKMTKNVSQRTLAVCCDVHSLPFKANYFDLVVSSMTLQWCLYERVFSQIYSLARKQAYWLFSTVGPDTLHELRAAWAAVDDHPHVHGFTDMHHLGDSLLHLGFKEPVLDIERVTMQYESVATLISDLRALGVVNQNSNRRRGLTGPGRYKMFVQEYESFRTEEDFLPASWEIIYGHARVPEAGLGVQIQTFGGQ
jgi:malonyl-CoA O-methyltransferase